MPNIESSLGYNIQSDFWGRKWNRFIHSLLKVCENLNDRSCLFLFIFIVLLLQGRASFFMTNPFQLFPFNENRQRGVYKPVRKYFAPAVAVAAAFIASGLFHEWILYAIYVVLDSEKDEEGKCSSCYYPPMHGKQLAFFMWNAMVIALEYLIGRLYVFTWMGKNLSPPLITALVIMASLPVAHWFLDDYMRSDFFHDLQVAFLLVRPLKQL